MASPALRHLLGSACAAALLASGAANALVIADPNTVTNQVSQFPITVDGGFTNAQEWSDVTPVAFIAPPDFTGQLVQTTLGNPAANSFLYAAVAPGASATQHELYLLYDYLNQTSIPAGGIQIRFPIQGPIVGSGAGSTTTGVLASGVQINPASPGTGKQCVGDNGPNTSLNCTLIPSGNTPAAGTDTTVKTGQGILTAVGFGRSRIAPNAPDHLQVELEVPLAITQTFVDSNPGTIFTPTSPDGYSPAPQFWGVDVFPTAGLDPPISQAIFTINPDGSIHVDPFAAGVPFINAAVPEPATLALFGVGLLGLGAARRRRIV